MQFSRINLSILIVVAITSGCGRRNRTAPSSSAPAPDAPIVSAPTDAVVSPVASTEANSVSMGDAMDVPLTGPRAKDVRWLDAAAEQELKEAFGIDREQRDAARANYSRQRWRFRATVGDRLNDFAVVTADGRAPLSLHFRTPEECQKVNTKEEHLFEATVEDMLSRHFVDGVVIKEEPTLQP